MLSLHAYAYSCLLYSWHQRQPTMSVSSNMAVMILMDQGSHGLPWGACQMQGGQGLCLHLEALHELVQFARVPLLHRAA